MRLPHIPAILNPLQKRTNTGSVHESVVELIHDLGRKRETKGDKKTSIATSESQNFQSKEKKTLIAFLSKNLHSFPHTESIENRFAFSKSINWFIDLFGKKYGYSMDINAVLNVLTVNFDLICCIRFGWNAIIRFANVDTVMNSIHVRHIYCVITYWRRCINR